MVQSLLPALIRAKKLKKADKDVSVLDFGTEALQTFALFTADHRGGNGL